MVKHIAYVMVWGYSFWTAGSAGAFYFHWPDAAGAIAGLAGFALALWLYRPWTLAAPRIES